MEEKNQKNAPITTINEDVFFEVVCEEEIIPRITESFFDSKLSDMENTVSALEYICQQQGYCPEDIICSFDGKQQTFKISFLRLELFETGRAATLIKTLCRFALKSQTKKIGGIEALECVITREQLKSFVLGGDTFVSSKVLIKEVLDWLGFATFFEEYDYETNVHFELEGQVLRMEIEDLKEKTIGGRQSRGTIEYFLLLSPLDREMAEYLLSLNCIPQEDKTIWNYSFMIEFEGQRAFRCYWEDLFQKQKEERAEKDPWVKTRLRTRKIEGLQKYM